MPLLTEQITNTSRTFLFIGPACDPNSYSFASNADVRYAIWLTEIDSITNAPVDIGYVECNASIRPTALNLPNQQARFFKKPANLKPIEILDMFTSNPNCIAGPCQRGDFINNSSKARLSKDEKKLYEIVEHLEAGRDVRWLSDHGYTARSIRVVMRITRCSPPPAVVKARTRLTVLQPS